MDWKHNKTLLTLQFYLFHKITCRQTKALGMENSLIPDGQIDASSKWDVNHAAEQGRLHFQATGDKAGAWSARTNDVNQWIQVDLIDPYTLVTGVATQGRNAFNIDQWVTKYRLRYSNDRKNFRYYKQQGKTQATDKVKLEQRRGDLLKLIFIKLRQVRRSMIRFSCLFNSYIFQVYKIDACSFKYEKTTRVKLSSEVLK